MQYEKIVEFEKLILEEQEKQNKKLVENQQKIFEFEKREKVILDIQKVLHKMPEGCIYPKCFEKLAKSFPVLPYSCANCNNASNLLKMEFIPPALEICKTCSNLKCAELTPLLRMRKILFKTCILFSEEEHGKEEKNRNERIEKARKDVKRMNEKRKEEEEWEQEEENQNEEEWEQE
jgi:predicted nucleic acid-binding Zn ribbon protein